MKSLKVGYGKHKKDVKAIYTNGDWVWYVTKMTKTTPIWEGLVKGYETEFGSFYRTDVENLYKVPQEKWEKFPVPDGLGEFY